MCTGIVYNGNKTIVGWNLDILEMEHRVTAGDHGVYIEINDEKEGWMPLFGANARGDFVAMPTCWPYDAKSDPQSADTYNIINLDIDLLLCRRTLKETREIVENNMISSVQGITFQAQLSDRAGNVLQITPGQGVRYIEEPRYSIMTNFSPFKGDKEKHPWMGLDRYETAVKMLESAGDDFDISDCFSVLKAASQTVCPTVVSMVFDVNNNMVYWCENMAWDSILAKGIRQ